MATQKIVATDKVKKTRKPRRRRNIFVMLGGYFKGAWFELREVRWPNRKATWSLTVAVLGFVVFFSLLITLLDALYKYLFELILK